MADITTMPHLHGHMGSRPPPWKGESVVIVLFTCVFSYKLQDGGFETSNVFEDLVTKLQELASL